MRDLKPPVYDKPDRPVQKYYEGTGKNMVESTNHISGGSINVAVMDDIG